MNKKIIYGKDGLVSFDSSDIEISSGKIVFLKNGDYVLEYVDLVDVKLDVEVKDGVFVKLFIFSKVDNLKISNHYLLGKGSNFILFQFFDSYYVNENTCVDLNGEYSKFYFGFSSISHGSDEYHIIVNHNKRCVTSDICGKCVGLDGSEVTIQIDSNLSKGNTDCVMEQSSRILTLGDVKAKIIPNMYIDENSVMAKHGSVIGGFSDDEIFYFMSRGISYDEAVLLLIKGFLFSNIYVDYEKRAVIMDSILNSLEVKINEC